MNEAPTRTVGLLGATTVGVGAIVGGGILVLAGAAFRAAGPGAILAFALNGLIAVITALSFAELAAGFPESGGSYAFARRVHSVRTGFAVGWALWSAYLVAAVLYALGFAAYAAASAAELWTVLGDGPPAWLLRRPTVLLLALSAVAVYTALLIRTSSGGGTLATYGKVLVFAVLIGVGAWALLRAPGGTVGAGMTPFLPFGATGVLAAMGFTFIALQGFDLIAAIGGEVQRPERNIPAAMMISLGIALAVYLPLLFLVSTVGLPAGGSVSALAEAFPETMLAEAARQYMGPTGYWLVAVAAVLSTLSALYANLLAASRVARTMARDRTLPHVLDRDHPTRGTPLMSLYAGGLAVAAVLLMVPDVAVAGAAASLIFLVVFALTHWTAILARRRGDRSPFRTPLFPLVPVVGGLACGGMAVFQAVAVPEASAVAGVWLGMGAILYVALFSDRAETVDAAAEAHDPDLARLRGRSPLILAPVANPQSAAGIIAVANALAPPAVGRVLLLSVVRRPETPLGDAPPQALLDAQSVLQQALHASLRHGDAPEALITIADEPWDEIVRVAAVRRCEALLLGLSRLDEALHGGPVERLLNALDCDVAILSAPPAWRLEEVRRVLVPIGGQGRQDELRARFIGSLCRTAPRVITFLRVLPASADEAARADAERALQRIAEDKTPGTPVAVVLCADDPVAALTECARDADLVIVGLPRLGGRKVFGDVAPRIIAETGVATLMLSRRG